LIGCARAAIDARHPFFVINARLLDEILPTLERHDFGHESPPFGFRGRTSSLHRIRERTLGRPTQEHCAALHGRSMLRMEASA
jgi:hypothetical protein